MEATLARAEPAQVRAALLDALRHGAAADAHLRYESAWHLARHAEGDTFAGLLKEESSDLRLAGLIALDVACYEGFPSRAGPCKLWRSARRVGSAGGHGSPADAGPAQLGRCVNSGAGETAESSGCLGVGHRPKAPAAAEPGSEPGPIDGPGQEGALYLEFLEAEGPTEASLKQFGRLLTNDSSEARTLAHGLARKFGPRAAPLADTLWQRLLDSRTPPRERVELLATLSHLDARSTPERWEKLLNDHHAGVRTEAVRSWRAFKGRPEMVAVLTRSAPALVKESPALAEDLAVVLTHLEADPGKLGLTVPERGRDALGQETLAALPKLPPAERQWRALTGRLVFERNACVKCHTTVNQDTPLAPSLKAVAKGQKPEYLIESLLYPSKVIKTGFETELLVTRQGKTHTGLVKDEGAILRVLNAESKVRIAKKDTEQRSVQKLSLMPEGQEKQMSREEFLDLIVYLQSLR